ncbi:unnamed protein product [Ambrosiozyma monospora]|uniref:Unnamed protein product n=1 Tax=Ambrosiozyma monospora TaxID=43982 RepID=A0A9W6YVZ8_AMBMO|nr:unnamed protein product [Ambrosiozyma monospora]
MDPIPPHNDQTDLVTAMLGGAISGAVTTALTYPFEYIKVTSQIENRGLIKVAAELPMNQVRPLFTGCGTLALGNALKGCSRMLVFNAMSNFMSSNERGQTSAPRVVTAGLLTGALESLWVIPFESMKTRLIENSMYLQGMKVELPGYAKTHDSSLGHHQQPQHTHSQSAHSRGTKTTKRPVNPGVVDSRNPRFKAIEYYKKYPSTTFPKIMKEIYATQGLRGFKQGSLMTIFRQCMNSMVWYSSYNSFQQLIDPTRDSITELELLGMGFASSCAVVAITQPIDLLKTRMQTRDYRIIYRDVMTYW